MKLFVETRSSRRLKDYRFLGNAPDAVWWSDFRRVTEFEGPSLILLGDGRTWRLIASAIQSSRRDSEGSTVRFTLVAEGVCAADDPDPPLRVVSCWLADTGRAAHESELGQRLDQLLTDEFVDYVYDDARTGDGVEFDVQSRLERVIADLPPAIAASDTELERWYASLSINSHPSFVARCRNVVTGSPALACALNNAAPAQLSELKPSGPIAVLLPDGPERPQPIPPPTRPVLVPEEVALGKPSRRGRSRVAKLPATRKGKLILAAVPLTILVLAALARLLF